MKFPSPNTLAAESQPNKAVAGLYTVSDLSEWKRREARYAVAMITLATVMMVGGSVISLWVGPPRGVFWMFGGVAGFFVGLALMEWYAPRPVWRCPWCDASFANRLKWVEKSRACPDCAQRVIDGGRLRDAGVMKRYHLQQQSALTAKWLWTPIVAGWFFLVMQPLWPEWFAGPDHVILLFPAMSVSAIWAYLRSGDSRTRLPAVMSLLLGFASLIVYLMGPLP